MTTETATSTVPLWIGGQETASTGSRHGQVTNSATGQAVRNVPFATSEDIDLAVDAARTAWPAWPRHHATAAGSRSDDGSGDR